jgi:thiol-disulfide isomerase/thioredoxin
MSKSFISGFLFFCVAVVLLSGPSCGRSTTSEQPAAPAGGSEAEKKSAAYPPVPAAVAQAEIKNLDGTTFKIEDLKGKVLLLNMWATWCGPCRSEMPTLVKMQDEFGSKDFSIIGLNTDDETVEAINKFAGEMKLNYKLVWSDIALQRSLVDISQFGGIPQSFLVDRFGHLRGVFKGANPADIQKMQELVAEVVAE